MVDVYKDLQERLKDVRLKLRSSTPKRIAADATAAAAMRAHSIEKMPLAVRPSSPPPPSTGISPTGDWKNNEDKAAWNWQDIGAGWRALLGALGKDEGNLEEVAYLELGDMQAWVLRDRGAKEVRAACRFPGV